MTRKSKWMFVIVLAPLALVLFVALGGQVVMRLWNWLLPPLFGWHQVTFWQALGLLALCRILFGGFGFHGANRAGHRRRLSERYNQMTPEERERLRQGLRGSCAPASSSGEAG